MGLVNAGSDAAAPEVEEGRRRAQRVQDEDEEVSDEGSIVVRSGPGRAGMGRGGFDSDDDDDENDDEDEFGLARAQTAGLGYARVVDARPAVDVPGRGQRQSGGQVRRGRFGERVRDDVDEDGDGGGGGGGGRAFV